MRWTLTSLVATLRALVSRSRLDDELKDEIDLHIELRRQSLVESGMDPRDAAYEARRMFGNVTAKREESRDVWTFPRLETVAQDIRYALRLLRRSPMFATIAVLSLGIGIGATTAVFTLIDAVLLRKLRRRQSRRAVILRWRSPATARMPAPSLSGNFTSNESGQSSTSFSLPTMRAVQAGAPRDVRVIGFAGYMAFNVAIDGTSESADAQAVSGNYFDTLGIVPAAGRLLGDSDDRPGAEPVAVISHAYWRQRFGARRRRDRQGDGRQRDACHDRRGIPRRLSRHSAGRRRAARDGTALASGNASNDRRATVRPITGGS